MHMRTTLNIDDALLGRATELSGLREKTAVVRAGLEALVARESARRLAALGGTDARVDRFRADVLAHGADARDPRRYVRLDRSSAPSATHAS